MERMNFCLSPVKSFKSLRASQHQFNAIQWMYIKLDLFRNGKLDSVLRLFYMDPATKTLCGQMICLTSEKSSYLQRPLIKQINHALSLKQIDLNRVSTVNIIMLQQHFKNYYLHAYAKTLFPTPSQCSLYSFYD